MNLTDGGIKRAQSLPSVHFVPGLGAGTPTAECLAAPTISLLGGLSRYISFCPELMDGKRQPGLVFKELDNSHKLAVTFKIRASSGGWAGDNLDHLQNGWKGALLMVLNWTKSHEDGAMRTFPVFGSIVCIRTLFVSSIFDNNRQMP